MLFNPLEPSGTKRNNTAIKLESLQLPEMLVVFRLEKAVLRVVTTGKEVPSLRSDSDNNTSDTLPTSTTLRSESERKDETKTGIYHEDRGKKICFGEVHEF